MIKETSRGGLLLFGILGAPTTPGPAQLRPAVWVSPSARAGWRARCRKGWALLGHKEVRSRLGHGAGPLCLFHDSTKDGFGVQDMKVRQRTFRRGKPLSRSWASFSCEAQRVCVLKGSFVPPILTHLKGASACAGGLFSAQGQRHLFQQGERKNGLQGC